MRITLFPGSGWVGLAVGLLTDLTTAEEVMPEKFTAGFTVAGVSGLGLTASDYRGRVGGAAIA